ncbi:plasmid partitioning protein RepB C-terminal domain-containing protein [Oricola sp.]|uniref:plasmid partitioning protein RepB C-terminal domain-containing protein n=1 Tax=Oricola sp. TaxID=1979950 RepID=UPI0025E23540|nr:plasmid partitioning protein RepB C-terminal domain-containing protein [Oricola sp.]MCI5073979.1 ParB N-terminal domain-containing protein [Oricola sp.]
MTARPAQRVEWIPIDRISVVNPRLRNKRVFKEIVENIAQIGLKRPITVTRRAEADGPFYDLVCGQGRLEAYQELGQMEVPALVVNADVEDCMISSLVENCARRQHKAMDLLQDIGRMRKEGYSVPAIASKTGLSAEYVYGVSRLLEQGEHRLLQSVEARTIPLSVAVEIAEADDHGVQRALQDAYEKGILRGKKLLVAKKLVERRRRRGPGLPNYDKPAPERISSKALLRAYEEDAEHKRDLIRRANATRDRLALISEALKRLSRDAGFSELLETEGLGTMPEAISRRIYGAAERRP